MDRTLDKAQENKTSFWVSISCFEDYTEIEGISVNTGEPMSRRKRSPDDF